MTEAQPAVTQGGFRGVFEGLPTEAIAEVAKIHHEVNIRVVRQSVQGRWASIGMNDYIIATRELLDLEDRIDAHCGGGAFLVEVRNPQDKTEQLMQRFKLLIAKPARPISSAVHTPQPVGPANGPNPFAMQVNGQLGGFASQTPNPVVAMPPMPPPPPPMMPMPMPAPTPPAPLPTVNNLETPQATGANVNYNEEYPPQDRIPPNMRGEAPAIQWAYYNDAVRQQNLYQQQMQLWQQQMQQALPPGASIPSDRMAIFQQQRIEQELAAERARAARLEEKIEALLKQNEKEAEALRIAREKAEREAQEAKHRAEMAALEARIAAITETSKAKKETSLEDWAKILVPLAPVLSTFVGAKKDEAKIEADREIKRQEMAQQQTQAMFAAMVGKKDDSMAVLMPLILKMMENNSPQARADAQVATAEVQMMQIKMLSDMLREQHSGPEQPVWYPLVERMLEGLQGALAVSQYNKMAQAQQAQDIHIPQREPAALPAPAPRYEARPAPAPAYEPARVSIMPQPQGDMVVTPFPAAAPVPAEAVQEEQEGEEYDGPDPNPIDLDWSAQTWGSYARRNPMAANITQLVYKNLPAEYGAFHTNEWRHIIFELHASQDAVHVGNMIAEYVDYLDSYDALPEPLREVPAGNHGQLDVVIGVLPVAGGNPAFAAAVLKATKEALLRLEENRVDEEDDVNEDIGETFDGYKPLTDQVVEHEDAFETAVGAMAGPNAN